MRIFFDTAATSILLASSLIHGVLATPPKCKQDKCFQAAQSNYNALQPKKSAGCHAYLNRVETPPIVTVTRAPKTVTVQTTVQATNTVNNIVTDYTTVDGVATVNGQPGTTTIVVKRDADVTVTHKTCPAPTASIATLPAIASVCKGGASAFVSACSCLGITSTTHTLEPCTTTVAGAVTTTTMTIFSTTDVAQFSTVVVPTTVVTGTSTVPASPAATTYSVPSNDQCTIVFGNGLPFVQYYSGAGFSEDPNNVGNFNAAAQAFPLDGSLLPCDAITSCATYAATDPNGVYYSFDLHYLASTNAWQCIAYAYPLSYLEPFDQANDDVVVAYGYFLALP